MEDLPRETTLPTPHPSTTKAELERQFTTFATLFAIASILITWVRAESVGWAEPNIWFFLEAAIGIASIAVLMRPAWCVPFVSLAGLHLFRGLAYLPHFSAADLVWLFAATGIVGSFVTGWIVHRTYRVNVVALHRSFAPYLRMMLIVTLTLIGVARFNASFMQLSSSTVVESLTAFRGQPTPEWLSYVTMSILLVSDLCIAFSLLTPALRRFGVGFGGVYFAWLAAIGLEESRLLLPLVFALLYLFTSGHLLAHIQRLTSRWIPLPKLGSAIITIITVLVVIGTVTLRVDQDNLASHAMSHQVMNGYAVAFVAMCIAAMAVSLADANRPRMCWVSLVMRNPLHYGLVILFAFVGAAPYFGLSTVGTLSNSSGLITETGNSNHLFLPQTYLVDYQTDLVKVFGSSDPELLRVANQGQLVTWFELVNYVAGKTDVSLDYMRKDGKRIQVGRVGDSPELSRPNSWLVKKLVGFRMLKDPFTSMLVSQRVAENHSRR